MRRFTDAELATVLAALRHWQRALHEAETTPATEGEACEPPEWCIANNEGTVEPLTVSQIDGLCERLNSASLPEWEDDSIQFPRLIAEINATQTLNMEALSEATGLCYERMDDLFERAQVAWEAIKAATGRA